MATDSKHARACYHPATAKGLRSAYRPTRTPARACTCKPNLEPASGARAPAAQTCGPAKPPNLERAWTGTASQPCASADVQTASGASAQCLCSRASNSRNAATHKPPCPPPHAPMPPCPRHPIFLPLTPAKTSRTPPRDGSKDLEVSHKSAKT